MLEIGQSNKKIPFALLDHEASFINDDKVLGDVELEWNWKPVGDWTTESLKIYATSGNSTTQQTGYNQWDHGEWK